MPHLICHYLVIRRLQHIANLLRLVTDGHLSQRHPFKQNLTAEYSVRRQAGFQMPQKCRLSAAGRAAEDQKLTPAYRKGNIRQRRLRPLRVCEAYMLETIAFHFLSSKALRKIGVAHSIKYTRWKLKVTTFRDA